MKTFVDFVVDASKETSLAHEFESMIQDADHKTVSSWLSGKGYDVQEEECRKIVDNRDSVKSSKLGLAY